MPWWRRLLLCADESPARALPPTIATPGSAAHNCVHFTGPMAGRSRRTRRLLDGTCSPFECHVTPQVWAYDDGGPIGCGDLWLPSRWTFLKVDGDVKYTEAVGGDSLLVEKLRQERLERAGFGVARVAARESTSGPLLLERVNRASAPPQTPHLSLRSQHNVKTRRRQDGAPSRHVAAS